MRQSILLSIPHSRDQAFPRLNPDSRALNEPRKCNRPPSTIRLKPTSLHHTSDSHGITRGLPSRIVAQAIHKSLPCTPSRSRALPSPPVRRHAASTSDSQGMRQTEYLTSPHLEYSREDLGKIQSPASRSESQPWGMPCSCLPFRNPGKPRDANFRSHDQATKIRTIWLLQGGANKLFVHSLVAAFTYLLFHERGENASVVDVRLWLWCKWRLSEARVR